MKSERFPTEAELCRVFGQATRLAGWVCYNETCGWDILLAHPDGRQIGVQAKLHANLAVLEQAVAGHAQRRGPDFRAVLVPSAGFGYRSIARFCKVHVFEGGTFVRREWERTAEELHGRSMTAFEWAKPGSHLQLEHKERHPLPAFVPDVPAGVSAPRRLTAWKIRAITLMLKVRRDGFVVRRDFTGLGLRPENFRPWLDKSGDRPFRFTIKTAPRSTPPDLQHPDIAAAIAKEAP